LVTYSYHN